MDHGTTAYTVQRPVNVLGIGGSTRPGSTAELALRATLAAAERLGAKGTVIGGAELVMPLYDPAERDLSRPARRLLEAVAEADALVIASPAYHGSTSGLLKNALDHIEELRTDERPYLSGRAVGCLTVAQGWQSGVATLGALRTITHALRGWPTPLGVVVNTSATGFTEDGHCADPRVREQMETMARQVVEFARMSHR
ncbi:MULTISPECIES: NADPH-dependent FMN reductase [Streptomyces]|uniref:NADPH-dependent FMN reductase n=1 Tax=Streptomyces TaxID=1883 RepID=UPI000A7DCADC|nr:MULTISPECIES: NADPH-dependent FMN reductase [Streptomyces]MDN3056137.1 NAD(P)H-dependent oxidoreductase [Streptomyces sp. SRF1]GLV79772.1 FMN reductase [Streptomyces hygroscopicus subsp. hygroscopicus]